MGRRRAPPERCWRRVLRAGGCWLLSLCGTALRGLRGLWSLAWVGTAQPLPQGHPGSCAGSKRGVWPEPGQGRGAAGCNRCTAAGWGLLQPCRGAAGCIGCTTAAAGWGLLQLGCWRAGEPSPRHPAAGASARGLVWLKALCGCAQQEPWGRGDSAPGPAFGRAGVSRPVPQVLLMCYKSCWDGAFQVTEELGTALQLRLEGSEEDADSDSTWEPGHTGGSLSQGWPRGVPGAGRCRGGWQELSCGARAAVGQQRRGDGSEAVLGRLDALEADVRFLCTELGAEKLLWSSRFLELLREQQSLRQRLQELPWQWNSADSPELLGEAEDQSASGSEGESPAGKGWELWGAQGLSIWGGDAVLDLPPALGTMC
ncbi:uncharacterized protein [Sylvia atricapilla]|uniref:uncharacterized protein n=1 Tax=Sylvia atricapilla TaxID=48155 RepID=UPI003393B24D